MHSSVLVIEPRGWVGDAGLKAILKRRELVIMLAMRSIRTRYRDTSLGVAWAFVQPLVYLLVLNTFFGLIARFNTGEIPYPLHLITGLTAFQLITKSIADGAGAIQGNAEILGKIYIPISVFPAASILSSLIDFAFPAILMVGFVIYYKIAPTSNLFLLPAAMLLLLVISIAIQVFMSVIAARFKDAKQVVPIVSQLLFFSTPIFYPLSMIPEAYRDLYGFFNPMVGAIELWRWSILGLEPGPAWSVITASSLSATLMLLISFVMFRWLAPSVSRYI